MDTVETPRIAIVGGGFCGTMVLANMVDMAEGKVALDVFEARDAMGVGTAYGAPAPNHLLNVRAARMGAFADDPEGFYAWLETPEGRRQIRTLWPEGDLSPESFVPRALYGAYLRGILAVTLQRAREKHIEVTIHRAQVTDAVLHGADSQRLLLTLDDAGARRHLEIDFLVLATGNLKPRRFSYHSGLIRGSQHYVEDVWHTGVGHLFPGKVDGLPADSEIVILGTGQTMADVALTLKANGFKGVITALSRNGWLPLVHRQCRPYPEWEWHRDINQIPPTLLALYKRLRQEIGRAAEQGYDWRSVIDSLRPITQHIWQRLKTPEKRRFLARMLTVWNIHRHRMPPEIDAQLQPMLQSGALKIIAGRIYYIGSDEDGLNVAYRRRGANRIETIRAALMLNCTGPENDIASSQHRLLKNLRDHGLITIGPLRIGIELGADSTAKGRAQGMIFPLGALLVGELLECTAVPELRVQAHQVAARLCARIKEGPATRRDKSMLSSSL